MLSAGVLHRVLPNGLTLLVQREASAPVVAVVTHVRAGYFDEPDEWVGIAHVLEHMYFKGTARRGPGEIARDTQLVGGYINAGTIYDKTVYCTVLPAAHGGLERALDVQADALTNAALDPDELSRELEVIVQEAKRKLDTPSAVAVESLYALLFRVHRMRRWRIGTQESLRRLTRDDVCAYYATRYTPDRVIVGVVGDVDPEEALERADHAYRTWSRPAAAIGGSPPEPNGADPRVRVLHGDVERPLASVGWRTVATLHCDTPALDVAATVLGGGRGSRLYRALRLTGLAARAHAEHYTPTEVGVFEIGVEADAGRLDDALARLASVVKELAEQGPTDEEVERARSLIATQWARRVEAMDGRASALCEAQALGDFRLADSLMERTLAVTAGDVRQAVARHLDPARLTGALYLPEGGSTRLAEAWPPTPAASDGSLWSSPARVHEVVSRRFAVAGESEQYPGGVEHRAYDGADVLVRAKPGCGIVTVSLQFPDVPRWETAANAGLSWLLARSATRGAGELSGGALALAAERLGGVIAPSVGADTIGWSMTVRAEALRDAAALLRLLAEQATLEPSQVAVERELQASDARRVRDDMFAYPMQRVLGEAFPQDAYGLPPLGAADEVLGLAVDEVRAWARRLVRRRAVVVVVGDVETAGAFSAVETLAGWPAPGDGVPTLRPPPAWEAGRGAEGRQKQQTALAMAFPAAPGGSADRYPLRVIGALLSGLAGRLFERLREQHSLAYTVAAVPWLARDAGTVLTYVATSPSREEEAREAMLGELRRLTECPPTVDELERARRYAAGAVELRQQSGRAIAAEILEAWVLGTMDTLVDTPSRLRAVSAEEVARVASAVLTAERRAEYVVRGAPR